MQDYLHHLAAKTYQNRKVALVENGTWAPQAAKCMRAIFDTMKNVEVLENVVSIKSTLSAENEKQLDELLELLK